MKNQTVYLEHANITVSNLDNAIKFFQTAFPDFFVRGGGERNGHRWIHLGNEETYVALNTSLTPVNHPSKSYLKNGINHIGFVVSDVSGVANRLIEAGFKRDYPREEETFRIRDYFADDDGNEYEFIQYLSNKVEERNSYDS